MKLLRNEPAAVQTSWIPAQYHWHMPSENTVDGHLYAAEVHFVHTAPLDEAGAASIPADNGGLAVLGVFFEEEACIYYLPKVDEEDDQEEIRLDEERNAKCLEDRAASDLFFDSM